MSRGIFCCVVVGGAGGEGCEGGPSSARMTAKMVRSVTRLAAVVAKGEDEDEIVWATHTHTHTNKKSRPDDVMLSKHCDSSTGQSEFVVSHKAAARLSSQRPAAESETSACHGRQNTMW